MATDEELDDYLRMQRTSYNVAGMLSKPWHLEHKDSVIGHSGAHNRWPDYDEFLFRGINTYRLIALEYGCGPARNIVKFHDRFTRIDGTDISRIVCRRARDVIRYHKLPMPNIFRCTGKTIVAPDESYDLVFSVICLQHIACYDIRFSIFKDIHRVLKPGGYFCFQMGFGGNKKGSVGYFDNAVDVPSTNGSHDVRIDNEQDLIDDLTSRLPFKQYSSVIRPTGPGDSHGNWIWVQVRK